MMKRKIALATAIAALVCSVTFGAGSTMLAVPARFDMVYFGFDLLKLLPRDLELACYKGDDRIEQLEVFDKAAREWLIVSPETWSSGAYRANSLVIAGENKAAKQLQGLSTWAQQVTLPSDRSKLEVVNAVNARHELSREQWSVLAKEYGFKFKTIEAPSTRERLRDKARARRAAEKARKENQIRAIEEAEAAEKARREQLARARQEAAAEERARKEAQLRSRRLQKDAPVVKAPQENIDEGGLVLRKNEVVKPRPVEKTAPAGNLALVQKAPAPEQKAPAPEQKAPAPVVVRKVVDKTLEAPFDGTSAIEEMPPALSDAARLKAAAEAKVPAAPEVKVPAAPEVKAPAAPEVKGSAAPEVKVPAAPETDLKAAVEAAVTEASAKAKPVAAEIRVPAKEAVKPQAVAVPEVKIPEAKVPATKAVEVATPEVKVPAAKPVEVTAPATPAAPEVQPVKTPEIKVPTIVLDPM